ncbi:hypothetical protein E2F43_15350 [Seongchinamella unica]|uniref:Ysc84 actin-binding domain-containing protein n=1 Tax=Seongchinamella unica TaxID=2547392 RepID=A0A4R5LQS7_9GAMM|nr:hypothetical protein [Seongchinamella unica]TDG12928.1 hypothetical protein E2F43_15350 [Seongchinamella unica]
MRRITHLFCLALALWSQGASADTLEQIQAKSAELLSHLRQQVGASGQLLRDAAGVLVFPDIVKVGFGVGDQYGEGVLLVDGKPEGYYSTAGAPFGLPLGVGFKSEVIVFVTKQSLHDFLGHRVFRVGMDGEVALITPESLAELSSGDIREEVLGFVLTDAGLMADLSLEGAKLTRLAR